MTDAGKALKDTGMAITAVALIAIVMAARSVWALRYIAAIVLSVMGGMYLYDHFIR